MPRSGHSGALVQHTARLGADGTLNRFIGFLIVLYLAPVLRAMARWESPFRWSGSCWLRSKAKRSHWQFAWRPMTRAAPARPTG